jgi:hypothetical protein
MPSVIHSKFSLLNEAKLYNRYSTRTSVSTRLQAGELPHIFPRFVRWRPRQLPDTRKRRSNLNELTLSGKDNRNMEPRRLEDYVLLTRESEK